jgi:hypothetical protein
MALVRFELTNINGCSKVVMRVLQFIEPPNPSDTVFQKEGELVKRCSSSGQERVWHCAHPSDFISPSSMKILQKTYPVDLDQ